MLLLLMPLNQWYMPLKQKRQKRMNMSSLIFFLNLDHFLYFSLHVDPCGSYYNSCQQISWANSYTLQAQVGVGGRPGPQYCVGAAWLGLGLDHPYYLMTLLW